MTYGTSLHVTATGFDRWRSPINTATEGNSRQKMRLWTFIKLKQIVWNVARKIASFLPAYLKITAKFWICWHEIPLFLSSFHRIYNYSLRSTESKKRRRKKKGSKKAPKKYVRPDNIFHASRKVIHGISAQRLEFSIFAMLGIFLISRRRFVSTEPNSCPTNILCMAKVYFIEFYE